MMTTTNTTARFDEARLAEVRERGLMHGMHADWADGACAVEAAAYIAGEPFGDHPRCVCPAIASFMRAWNDSLPDADRNRLLIPLLPHIVGTRDSDTTAARRSWMALDWLVRVHTPAWLALSADLREHAAALRALLEINSGDRLVESWPLIAVARNDAWGAARDAARKAARDATWAAAGAAARAAAGDAVSAAARDAAWDGAGAAGAAGDAWAAARDDAWAAAGVAAGDAAGDAVGAAAGAAAWDGAGAAGAAGDAWDAAWAAARAALQPTVVELQESAADLVRRMCSITEI